MATVKGYGKITNGTFTVKKVAYVKGLIHILISVSQLCVGTGHSITFDEEGSMIKDKLTKKVFLKSKRQGDMYPMDMTPISGIPLVCLLSKVHKDVSWLSHRRFSHLKFRSLNKLFLGDNVRGLPVLKFDNDNFCVSCEYGKQSQKGHALIIDTKILDPLELLHMDLYGQSTIESVSNKYILVIIDYYSRFTCVYFLKNKSETSQTLVSFITYSETQPKEQVRRLRSENGI